LTLEAHFWYQIGHSKKEPPEDTNMDTLKTRLTVNRLHPLFVAEVTGIDLAVSISREHFRST